MSSELIVVLPDLHIPYHDEAALDCAMQAIQHLKPARVIILGDWLDCASFSAHGVSRIAELHAVRFVEDEVQPCCEVLDEIQRWTDDLIFIEGNHEFRVERFAASWGSKLGPDIYKLMAPGRLLGENRTAFTYIPYSDPLAHYEVTPNLWAIHGWTHAKTAARKHLEKARSVSIVYGHTHRQEAVAIRDPVTQRVMKAWSPGCLSKLQPLYMAHNPTEWVQGFSLIYVSTDDRTDWTEYNITIDRGRCILPDGKVLRAK